MSRFRFFRRRQADAELEGEIELYLAEETADNTTRGMTPEEARRQARIKREPAKPSRNPLAAKHGLGCRYPEPRLEVRGQNARTYTWFLADRDGSDGLVHRRNDFAFHGCPFGAAASAPVS